MSTLVFLLFLFHFLGFQHHVALGATLLVLLVFRLEPFFAAVGVEEVPASWNPHDRYAIIESVHADDTIWGAKLINSTIILHFFKRIQKLLGVLKLH